MSFVKAHPPVDAFSTKLVLLVGVAWGSVIFTAHSQSNYDFTLPVSDRVYSILQQPDGKILVDNVSAPLRLNTNGVADPSFAPALSNYDSISTMLLQEDGKILVGGSFTFLGTQVRSNLARFNADGSLDTSFHQDASDAVGALTGQSGGRSLVGGAFTMLGPQTVAGLGRINSNDAIDATFAPACDNSPSVLAVQADGLILVGGLFSSLAGQPRGNLGRLHDDGSIDPNFAPAGLGPVNCFAVQSDGKILVAAEIPSPDGTFTANLARFWPDGSRDTNFNALANGAVNAIAVQADGKVIVGGEFDWLGASTQYGLGRLNPDGYPDTTFIAGLTTNTHVYAVALQPDGKILFGTETTGGGQITESIARVQNSGPATESLTWTGTSFQWLRSGTAPELWRTGFQSSTNGTNWVDLGAGTRISGGWSSPGLPALPNGTIRARGWVSSGQYGCPSWYVERTFQPPPIAAAIMMNDGKFGFHSNRFGFSYTAPTNRTVVVQGAPDFINWQPLSTNVMGPTPAYFSDPQSATLTRRNYRLLLLP